MGVAGTPLPDGFDARPFRVTEALGSGLTRRRLRQPDLVAPTPGVRTGREPTSLAELVRVFAVALPDGVAFSHLTAARLLGIPLPMAVEQEISSLDVMCRSTATRIRRTGCLGHRGLELRDTVQHSGVRVTGLADTWIDLGEVMDRGLGLDDLIVAGDYVAGRLRTTDPLRQRLDRRTRPRGKRFLTAALREIRVGVLSPMETRARLMFVRAGLAQPEVNATVDDWAGEWLMMGDLVWRRPRVVVEYQGSVHAPIEQRSIDAQRRDLAESNGWLFIEMFKEDVYRPARRAQLITRLRVALTRNSDLRPSRGHNTP